MAEIPSTGTIENEIADAATMVAALRQANAAALAAPDAPTTLPTFGELTALIKLLTALGLFTVDQAIALLKALEHGEGITQLPDLPSPEGMVLYDTLRLYIARQFGSTDVSAEQLIEDVVHFVQEAAHIVVEVVETAGAVASWIAGLFH